MERPSRSARSHETSVAYVAYPDTMKPAPPPFQSLVDAHADAVSIFLRGLSGRHAADDLLQETFLAALRGYAGFDGANPRAWLLTIARRKAIDAARAARRRPEPLLEPEQVAASRSGPPLEGEVWKAVAELPEKQRAATVLRFALDLRYREIGEALGCSEAAARQNVQAALGKLRAAAPAEQEVRA